MGATVLIIGLGDLGTRVLQTLAAMPNIDRLVGAARDTSRAEETAQAALLSRLAGMPARVDFARVDLANREGTAALLRRLEPEIVVMAASRQTWWRPLAGNQDRAAALASLSYGVWLPLHVTIVRQLMEARREAGVESKVVSLPFPDAVGPVLKPLNLAPTVGAGNITEVAAKLSLLAERQAGVEPDRVSTRLVMHHAAERYAFGVFGELAGAEGPGGEPPWAAEIRVGTQALDASRVAALFHASYPLPPGRASQQLTAGAAAHLVAALLSEQPVATHAPSPHGLPGGYPVQVSRTGFQVDLPDGMGEGEAIVLNQEAARWDGIAGIDADGTVHFTKKMADATQRVLGLRLEKVMPAELDDVADELVIRAAE